MLKEDFLFLMGDKDPDERFIDSFLMDRTTPTPSIVTSSGNPLNIRASGAQNAISTLISYSPKQSGTGVPSPENIRPIYGYSTLTLTVNGTDIIISLGDTYYGGTIDLENGTAEINYALVDMGEMNYSYNSDTLRFTNTTLAGSVKRPLTNDDVVPMVCESYKTDKYNDQEDFTIAFGTSGLLSIRNSNYTSSYQFKQSVVGVFLAYPLASPQTINLTPQNVSLLNGVNVLSTDGDNITITYSGFPMMLQTLIRRELMTNDNMGRNDKKSIKDVRS